ncbi:carnosine dipeptidase 2, partial [Homo sapiens]
DELIFARKDTFFKDVDYVCISDNYWLGKKKPCITYGLRGICYFFIEVECSNKDLHSGVYGGSVHEAMTDLILLMGSLFPFPLVRSSMTLENRHKCIQLSTGGATRWAYE